ALRGTSDTPGFPAIAWARSSTFFLVHSISETRERVRVLAPVRKHLHPEIEIDVLRQKRFDFGACRLSNAANPRTLAADEDPLLTIALDVQDRTNIHRALALPKLLDFTRDAVWHFIAQLLERRFADQLTHEEAQMLGADFVFGIEKGALRE